jgi:hypothetical protein
MIDFFEKEPTEFVAGGGYVPTGNVVTPAAPPLLLNPRQAQGGALVSNPNP